MKNIYEVDNTIFKLQKKTEELREKRKRTQEMISGYGYKNEYIGRLQKKIELEQMQMNNQKEELMKSMNKLYNYINKNLETNEVTNTNRNLLEHEKRKIIKIMKELV